MPLEHDVTLPLEYVMTEITDMIAAINEVTLNETNKI